MPEDLPTSSANAYLDERYQAALRYVKEGRWTEAKRTLAEVAELDPEYRNLGKLQEMVDEVMAGGMHGFGIPSHVASQMRPAAESFDPEEDDTTYVSPRRTGLSVPIKAALIVIGVLTCYGLYTIFTR